ncbi:MAG: hypothetical protein WC342_07805 [Methanoregula sp.]
MIVPLCSAAPGEADPVTPYLTTPVLNVTNASVANQSFPKEFRETPTLLSIGVSTNDTGHAGPKGEMAATPRTIGFEIQPGVLAAVIIIIITAIGALLYIRQKKSEKKEE